MRIPYNLLLAAVTLLIARAQAVKSELEQIDSKNNDSQPQLLPSLKGFNASIEDVLQAEQAVKNATLKTKEDPIFKFLDDTAKNYTQSLESNPTPEFSMAREKAGNARKVGKKPTNAPTAPDVYGAHPASEIPCSIIGMVYIDDSSRAYEAKAAQAYYAEHTHFINYNGKKVEVTFIAFWKFNPTTTPKMKNYIAYTIVPKGTDLKVTPLATPKKNRLRG